MIKTDFDAKLSSFKTRTTENKTTHLLAQNELNQLKTFDLSYFIDKNHFEEDDTHKYFTILTNTKYISSFKLFRF